MKTLEDFHVGETFGLVRECDRYRPVYYAAVSGDFNPLHIDPEAGRRAGQGGAILQGMCTLAWVADACVRYFEDPTRLAQVEVRFARPVRVGDVVTFAGRCASIEDGRVRVEVSGKNQRGEDVVQRAAAVADFGETRPRIDREPLGRRWGPYPYTVGLEEIRDFAVTIAGGIPGRAFAGPPPEPSPFVSHEVAGGSPPAGAVAPPMFAARFAIQPFAAVCIDPALEIGLDGLLHGEQRFEFGAPVRPGDRLETVGELVGVERKGPLELFTVRTTTTNQGGASVVVGTWVAVRRAS